MPPKPTCKLVKRQGQTGARIDPKGCKVRPEKDATTRTMRRNNWNNETPAQKAAFGSTHRPHRILYDTGANGTVMTPALLRKLGEDPHRKTNVSHTMMTAAVGLPHRSEQRKTTVHRRGAHRAPALMQLYPHCFRSLRASELAEGRRYHRRRGRTPK
jgi:hypothetical protein